MYYLFCYGYEIEKRLEEIKGIEMEPASAPDYTVPFVGYRVWRLDVLKEKVASLVVRDNSIRGIGNSGRPIVWEIVPSAAKCIGTTFPAIRRFGEAPHSYSYKNLLLCNARCGFNAYKQLEFSWRSLGDAVKQALLKNEYFQIKNEQDRQGFVLGKVALWGKIIEYERGYRAEYARPVEFFKFPGTPSWGGTITSGGFSYPERISEDRQLEKDPIIAVSSKYEADVVSAEKISFLGGTNHE